MKGQGNNYLSLGLNQLTPSPSRDMCMRYAQLETKLGEVDRARSVYSHGSQFSDPRVGGLSPSLPPSHCLPRQATKTYWKVWQEFEVRYGNEDTFREMLRIKRSVQAQYNTQVNLMSAQMFATASKEMQVTGQPSPLLSLLS